MAEATGLFVLLAIWIASACESTTRYIIEEELEHCLSRECCQEQCGEEAKWHPIRGCECPPDDEDESG